VDLKTAASNLQAQMPALIAFKYEVPAPQCVQALEDLTNAIIDLVESDTNIVIRSGPPLIPSFNADLAAISSWLQNSLAFLEEQWNYVQNPNPFVVVSQTEQIVASCANAVMAPISRIQIWFTMSAGERAILAKLQGES
jgi:hypothetical protein